MVQPLGCHHRPEVGRPARPGVGSAPGDTGLAADVPSGGGFESRRSQPKLGRLVGGCWPSAISETGPAVQFPAVPHIPESSIFVRISVRIVSKRIRTFRSPESQLGPHFGVRNPSLVTRIPASEMFPLALRGTHISESEIRVETDVSFNATFRSPVSGFPNPISDSGMSRPACAFPAHAQILLTIPESGIRVQILRMCEIFPTFRSPVSGFENPPAILS